MAGEPRGLSASGASAGTEAENVSPSNSNASPSRTPRTISTASRIGPSVFLLVIRALLRKIFEVPKPSRKRSGPAASWTTRASIATWTGWRVNGEMIPQPTVSCSVWRAINAETTVEERASIPCLRHQGYASASQIGSMPASSITRADASISSSGSIVSCMTPTRNGWVTLSAGVFDRGGRLFAFGAGAGRLLHLFVERVEDVGDLLADDRLQHALPHRPDRP